MANGVRGHWQAQYATPPPVVRCTVRRMPDGADGWQVRAISAAGRLVWIGQDYASKYTAVRAARRKFSARHGAEP